MEKRLDYDRRIVPQETPYWCGPAATQVVLNSLGVRRDETALAREMGTHRGGTDHIGLIVPVLNKHAPNARYTSRAMPNDPPTIEQQTQLWVDLKLSIDGGYGVVANIVAPRSNYPRGVKGSVSPSYGGGTVYHYIALMGYSDDAEKAVWVADSGFSPYGYWLGFDQLCTLIPPKGYAAFMDAPSLDIEEDAAWADNLIQFVGRES